jgi:hypothetical protein
MNILDLYWPDSDIKKITIEFNELIMLIFNDVLQQNVVVICKNFIGLDNFCIWDDTIITDLQIQTVCGSDLSRISMLKSYRPDINYGNRYLSDGVLDISVELTNDVVFHIYCQTVQVNVLSD